MCVAADQALAAIFAYFAVIFSVSNHVFQRK